MTVHTVDIYLRTYNLIYQLEQHTYRMLYEHFTLVRFSTDMCRPSYINFQNFHFGNIAKTHSYPRSIHPNDIKYNLEDERITKTFFPTTTHTKQILQRTDQRAEFKPYLYPQPSGIYFIQTETMNVLCVYSYRYVCIWFYVDSKIAATLVNVTLYILYSCVFVQKCLCMLKIIQF